MAVALLYTLLFACGGCCIAQVFFYDHAMHRRLWLGLAIGLLLLTWLPSLFAFLFDFTILSHILAAIVLLLVSVASVWFCKRKNRLPSFRKIRFSYAFLFVLIPLFLLGAGLFHTHIIQPMDNGGIRVGQVTYGDLAMHLGFISSIATQGTFPPDYSIFPGHAVNYPFLCETSASSLYLLGATLREAYLITALYAYAVLLIGVYVFFEQWLKRKERAVLASFLFFLGSGFGFAYFFDLAKTGASLSHFLGGTAATNMQYLLDGFYQTPTNLPTIGLRWVNPIVDMIVPQRATLFGWAFLFPCLYLLHGYAFLNRERNLLPLALIAGLLPLIHTHSFLALGIISAVYLCRDLFPFRKRRVLGWLFYGGIAVLLAAPQLFGFTFQQAAESSMVRLHLNWANEADSLLWFYLKNWGMLFILFPFAFFLLSKRDRGILTGPLVLWLIAEIVAFQPNVYDQNKLIFVFFAYLCGLVAKFLGVVSKRIWLWLKRHTDVGSRTFTNTLISGLVLIGILLYCIFVRQGKTVLTLYKCFTLLFFLAFATVLCVCSCVSSRKRIKVSLCYAVCSLALVVLCCSLCTVVYREYANAGEVLDASQTGRLQLYCFLIALALGLSGGYDFVWSRTKRERKAQKKLSVCGASLAAKLGCFVLAISLFLSSGMNILREYRSEYQVYSASDVEAITFIQENTEKDATFLANSYLWNLVTPLTGRNIVTGTSTFLYFHGINNSTREADVRLMYETPETVSHLFEEYGVDYILVGGAEYGNYAVNEAYFAEHYPLFYDGSVRIYQVHP